MERKAISKALRFEVFKRDSFTCQYCGRSAPDVILEVDHIDPVAKGGKNDIVNLITSCRDCNRGKRDKRLSDDTVVKRQKAQLDELNERREQMQMMVEWRESLFYMNEDLVESIDDYLGNVSKWRMSDTGKMRIRKLIKQFGFQEVYTSTEIAFEKYFNGAESSWRFAFDKIGGVCYNRRKQRQENGD